jgi:sugar (pentulose or hexulose) kinase
MDPQTAGDTLAAACGLGLTGGQILGDPTWLRPAFRAAADRMRFDPAVIDNWLDVLEALAVLDHHHRQEQPQ